MTVAPIGGDAQGWQPEAIAARLTWNRQAQAACLLHAVICPPLTGWPWMGKDPVMADTKMTKTIGEHWVCATLARHDWAPALTRDGVERTDILAVGIHLAHRPTVEIQVKTATQHGDWTNWLIGAKAQLVAESEHEWFVFVLVPELPGAPRAFVVPRNHVSAAAWIGYWDWRTDPSVPAGKRSTPLSQARVYWPTWQKYEDRWDLLGTPTTEVPVLLPSELRDLAQEKRAALPFDYDRIGWPPGHPWNDALPQW